ncbi:hypothetical protein V8E53_000421 [Lactarius tabidus]
MVIQLYSISRLGAMGNAICNLVGFNVTHEINCQQWITFTLILAYTSFACASALIALRVTAIWRQNYLVMGLTIGMWLINVGFLLYGIVTVRSAWSASARECAIENTFQSRDNITVTVATDVAQLILMLVGLLRSRQTKHGLFRHLYVQGLIWLLAATIGEVPAAVGDPSREARLVFVLPISPSPYQIFINLNLNDPLNMMFQNLALYTMQICATRMYRDLVNYNMAVEKYSNVPEFIGGIQRGLTTASTTITPRSRGHSGFPGSENWELSFTDKSTTINDVEKEPTKVPSLAFVSSA